MEFHIYPTYVGGAWIIYWAYIEKRYWRRCWCWEEDEKMLIMKRRRRWEKMLYQIWDVKKKMRRCYHADVQKKKMLRNLPQILLHRTYRQEMLANWQPRSRKILSLVIRESRASRHDGAPYIAPLKPLETMYYSTVMQFDVFQGGFTLHPSPSHDAERRQLLSCKDSKRRHLWCIARILRAPKMRSFS